MKIQIISVGQLKEAYWRAAQAEYVKRLERFGQIRIIEIKEERLGPAPSAKEIAQALAKEGQEIERYLDPKLFTYTLAIEGRARDSLAWARELEEKTVGGHSGFSFVIGSSHGLAPTIKQLGAQLSFSPMTFPHQMMRIILLEQVYRAFKINHKEDYHK